MKKKDKTFKNSIYDIYLVCLALALEYFWISKYYIEADIGFYLMAGEGSSLFI